MFSYIRRYFVITGAERLVKHLHTHDVPIALATSSSLESVELKTSKHKELFKLFCHLVSATSDPAVKQGKPAPDVFLVCASRFSDKPDPQNVSIFCTYSFWSNIYYLISDFLQCLVFEDAPNGVKAAHSAGMQVVLVPEDYVSEEDKSRASLAIKSLNDFEPELFGLPPFPA